MRLAAQNQLPAPRDRSWFTDPPDYKSSAFGPALVRAVYTVARNSQAVQGVVSVTVVESRQDKKKPGSSYFRKPGLVIGICSVTK
jgi:hypothetical protein